MTNRSYGDMWISGGQLHNDNISVINVTNNLQLSIPQRFEIEDFLLRLARTASYCEAIEDQLEAHHGQNVYHGELAGDITSLRASLNSLRIHIEDACSEGYELPKECTTLLQDIVHELIKVQRPIDEVYRWSPIDTSKLSEDNPFVLSLVDVVSLRKRLTSMREKVSVTTIVVIHCTQLKVDSHQSRKITDLKQRLHNTQMQLEYQALSRMPFGPPLRQEAIEQADYKTDKSFVIRNYLKLLTREQDTFAPPTPSVQTKQFSSIGPSSASDKIPPTPAMSSSLTPVHSPTCRSCQIQVLIQGVLGKKVTLIRVKCHDEIRIVWEKLHHRFPSLAPFALSRRCMLLDGNGTIAINEISSLETLCIEWDSLRTPPGATLPLVEVRFPSKKSLIFTPDHFPAQVSPQHAKVEDLEDILMNMTGHSIKSQMLIRNDSGRRVSNSELLRDYIQTGMKLVQLPARNVEGGPLKSDIVTVPSVQTLHTRKSRLETFIESALRDHGAEVGGETRIIHMPTKNDTPRRRPHVEPMARKASRRRKVRELEIIFEPETKLAALIRELRRESAHDEEVSWWSRTVFETLSHAPEGGSLPTN